MARKAERYTGMPELDRIIEGRKFPSAITYYTPRALLKNENSEDMNREDRISKLPSDVLQYIISLLPAREGATTSILARHWRNLWSTSVSCLDFNVSDMIEDSHRWSQQERSNQFLSRINQVMQLHRDSRLEVLRVRFPIGTYEQYFPQIDIWMKAAATEGTKEVVLDFANNPYARGRGNGPTYTFPFWIFAQSFSSSLNYLSLRFCIFKFPPDFKGFNSLVSLTLKDIFLAESDVQNMLSNCSSLEWLSLRSCEFETTTKTLAFSGPTLILKHLRMKGCTGIAKIEVHDMNIRSFELEQGLPLQTTILSIKSCPHLARLALFVYKPTQILGNLPPLDVLFLSWLERCVLPKYSFFNNLKRLVLQPCIQIDFLQVLDLLEYCRLLEKLEIELCLKVSYANCEIQERRSSSLYNLKEVVMHAFDGGSSMDIELARYLLVNAVALEKMTLKTHGKSYRGNGVWGYIEWTGKPWRTKVWRYAEEAARLREARDVLQTVMRPSTELVIVPP